MPKVNNNDIKQTLTRQDTILNNNIEEELNDSISIYHNPNIKIKYKFPLKKCLFISGIITFVTFGNIVISYLIYHKENNSSFSC
jgi:hypothetical protein